MDEGVYINHYNDDNVKQIICIDVKIIGEIQGKKQFRVKEICFTFVRPGLIFPVFKEKNETIEYSPLVINTNNESSISYLLTEGSRQYNYYIENYKKSNITFRMIEHLYEEYKSIYKTINDVLNE